MKMYPSNYSNNFIWFKNSIVFENPKIVALLLLYMIYFSSFALFIFGLISSDPIINNGEFDIALSAISLTIFIFLLTVGCLNRAYYFFCLPLVVLIVPNAINDLLPSFWAGPISDRGVASVSLLTHIDLFLLVGVFLFARNEHHSRQFFYKLSNFLIFICLLISLTSIIWWSIASSFIEHNALLFFGNSFQIRYLLYVSLFLRFVYKKDLLHFFWGLFIGIGFLIFEALIYSFLNESEELTSGNFGTNTLGVLLGFLLIYISSIKECSYYIKGLLSLFILAAIFLSGTRIAMIALLLSFGFSSLILRYGMLKLGVFPSIIVVLVLLYYWKLLVPFVDPFLLLIETDYAFVASQDLAGGSFSSLMTRLSLWLSSLDIIIEFPFGVGLSQFNFLKASYGFSLPIFIDPHNDYLNFIVQYGIFNGLIFIFLLYVYPLYLRFTNGVDVPRNVLIKLIFFIWITSLTNSNFNKHQFFFMTVFIIFVAINNRIDSAHKIPKAIT